MSRGETARRYETMVVLRADLLEAGLKEQVERLRKLLEQNGAEIGAVHEWGLRELAYEIEKQRRGYYVLFEYTGASAAVAELERMLKLSDVVLRFVSVRQEKDAPPAAALVAEPAPGGERESDRGQSDRRRGADGEDEIVVEAEAEAGDLE